jgi:hypothetical protein
MTEKLRSGVNGKVREAIQQSVSRAVVSGDGSLTIEMKPDGLLGLDGTTVPLGCRGRESNPHEVALAGF